MARPTRLNTAKTRRWPLTLFILGSAWLLAHGCFWLLPNVFEPWNARMVDQLFLWRESIGSLRPVYDDMIVHIDLNDTSIQRLDNFYLTRRDYAQVIHNLSAMGVAAQAHDFIFAAPTRDSKDDSAPLPRRLPAGPLAPASQKHPDDEALIQATAAARNVYFGMSLKPEKNAQRQGRQATRAEDLRYLEQTKWSLQEQGDRQGLYHGVTPLMTFANLASAARGLGYLNVPPDRGDGIFRRVPLLVRYAGAFYPSLALRVMCDYLQVPPHHMVITPGKHLVLRQARRPQVSAPHDIVIPIDRYGNMIINYVGSWERFKHYHFVDVLQAANDRDELELWKDELAGKLVVVSDVSTGSPDIGATPFDVNFPLSGLHTNIMHTILTENFLRPLSRLETLGIELVLVLIIFGLAMLLPSRWFVVGALVALLGSLGFGAGCFFYAQTVNNLLSPLLLGGFATLTLTVVHYLQEEKAKLEGLRQRDRIRSTFGRYLSNSVVDEILESPKGLEMGGEVRQITLLVSDLRGFTSLSARLAPQEVLAILNRYFERMLDIIERYRGTVDELQGDGILAFFGAPWAAPDDPERAVACAIAMQTALRDLNAEQRLHNLPELAMGIGINTGEVIIGNIGSLKRTKYGAVGSAINTAYRIESYTVGGQILLSPRTYAAVQSSVQVHSTIQVEFKGLHEPVTLYDVQGITGTYQLSLPDKVPVTLHPLATPLNVSCLPLSGKIVATHAIPGVLTHLTGSAATALFQEQVEVYSNLKLCLTSAEGTEFPDVYAKVLALVPSGTTPEAMHVRLELTSMPDPARTFLAGLEAAPVTS